MGLRNSIHHFVYTTTYFGDNFAYAEEFAKKEHDRTRDAVALCHCPKEGWFVCFPPFLDSTFDQIVAFWPMDKKLKRNCLDKLYFSLAGVIRGQ